MDAVLYTVFNRNALATFGQKAPDKRITCAVCIDNFFFRNWRNLNRFRLISVVTRNRNRSSTLSHDSVADHSFLDSWSVRYVFSDLHVVSLWQIIELGIS